MPTRPVQGGSNGTWGTELNAWLDVSHDSTGRVARDDLGVSFGDSGSFVHLRRVTSVPSAAGLTVAEAYGQAYGTRTVGAYTYGLVSEMADHSKVASTVNTISNAVNNGSGLIRITCTAHGFSTNDWIGVYNVGGTTEANGAWQVTVIDANTFDLQGSAFTHAYTSGGNATNRPGMYGEFVVLIPKQTRSGLTGTAQNADDLNGIGVFNGSANSSTATSAYLVNRNSAFSTNTEFFQGLEIEANVTAGVRIISACTWGIDLYGGGTATYSGGPIRLNSGGIVYGRKGDNSTDIALFRIRSDTNEFELMNTTRLSAQLEITDGVNFDLGVTNGTKIGLSTTSKLGFFNATPVVQQSGVGTATGYTAGATTGTFHTDDKYSGNVGSTSYTINGVVAALKNLGLLAQ